MGDTIRRGRGMKVGNGVVKREIVRFLFSREDGSATESEIRAHLFERFGVQDRATIRNQHLGYLKTTGRLEVAHEPGKENVWSVVDSPSIADYLFAEFAGDDLAEVYRSPFVRERVVDWFCTRREEMEISPETMACARDLSADRTWEQFYLWGTSIRLEGDAVELSPSHYTGAATGTHEGRVAAAFLLVSGRPVPHESGDDWNPPAIVLGFVIADLLVDFERYAPLRREIYAFMLRPELHRLMVSIFPPETIRMIFRCLELLIGDKPGFSEEERGPIPIETEPLVIPPPPPDWGGA